jgi:hypothetical protein
VKYDLPNICSDKEGFTKLAKLKNELDKSIGEEFIIDFSGCNLFDANMAAPLQALLANKKTSIVGLSKKIERLLRKNKFLIQYGYLKLSDRSKTKPLPYQCFQFSERHLFNEYLNKNLSDKGIPKMSSGLDKKFRQSIFEIFENCVLHSRSNQGIFVCGQSDSKKGCLDLTIADAGIGIHANVKQKFPSFSPVQSLFWAIQQGHTTKTGSQPGGFGLTLLQEFIERNNGKIQIASGHGYYEFSNGNKRFETLDIAFLGTAINLEINTNDNNHYCLRSEISSLDDLF